MFPYKKISKVPEAFQIANENDLAGRLSNESVQEPQMMAIRNQKFSWIIIHDCLYINVLDSLW